MQVSYKAYTPTLAPKPKVNPAISFGGGKKRSSEAPKPSIKNNNKLVYALTSILTLVLGASVLDYWGQNSTKSVPSVSTTSTTSATDSPPTPQKKKAKKLYDGMPIADYIHQNIRKTETGDPNIIAEEDLHQYFQLTPQEMKKVMAFMAELLNQKTQNAVSVGVLLYLSEITNPIFTVDKEYSFIALGLSYQIKESQLNDPDSITGEERIKKRQAFTQWILNCADNPEYRERALKQALNALAIDGSLKSDDEPAPEKNPNKIDT